MLTGNSVESLSIATNASGETYTTQGGTLSQMFVSSAGYLGSTDRYIDIRVYDAPDPIKELQRLYALHKLYFFTTDSADLLPITPALQKELETILLVEPANQPQKWLAAPQPTLNETFLTALANFMYWENYDVRVRMDGKIDRVALEDIRKNRRPRR